MTHDLEPMLKAISVYMRYHFKQRRVIYLLIYYIGFDWNKSICFETARERSNAT